MIEQDTPHSAVLLVGESEHDSNLYYASRFLAPDEFIYLELKDKTYLIVNEMEQLRARQASSVDYVLSFAQFSKSGGRGQRHFFAAIVTSLLREADCAEVTVPETFPALIADLIRERGIRIRYKADPFFEQRAVKNDEEVAAISFAQQANEMALEAAVKVLRASEIQEDKVFYDGDELTVEFLRKVIALEAIRHDCVAELTTIAVGDQGCDPHQLGHGPVVPNQTIVFDIFPRSMSSRYLADMSRTFVKGCASPELKKIYDAVRTAQDAAIKAVSPGVNGKDIHQVVLDVFAARGYKTELVNGRMQGYFHGTGHGVGLNIHEKPHAGGIDQILQPGHVITIEPGLYYPGIGAVRLEDMLVITGDGNINLTTYPRFLEIP